MTVHAHDYPDEPGHRGVDTSIEAVRSIDRSGGYLQRIVFRAIRAAGSRGLTTNEVATAVNISRDLDPAAHVRTEEGSPPRGVSRRNQPPPSGGVVMMTPHAAATAFVDAMCAHGIEPAGSIINELLAGELVRFDCVGDRHGRKNGWAKLNVDHRPAGSFGTHKGEFRSSWVAERPARTFSKEDRVAYRAKCEAERRTKAIDRAAGHDAVAIDARAMIATAEPAIAHPYLSKKRIVGEGMFLAGRTLLVPMQDSTGRIWNIQRIYPDGTKLFLKGGRVEGLFWFAGNFAVKCSTIPLCIGEGVGTMAAVRRATGHAVAAAISAANLEPVARALRQRWPDRPMIVCADDDAHLIDHPRIRRNLGIDAAKAAAAAIGARVALPPRSCDNG